MDFITSRSAFSNLVEVFCHEVHDDFCIRSGLENSAFLFQRISELLCIYEIPVMSHSNGMTA